MTLEGRTMLLAKIGFLAVLTLMIMAAGKFEDSSGNQMIQGQLFLGQ